MHEKGGTCRPQGRTMTAALSMVAQSAARQAAQEAQEALQRRAGRLSCQDVE